MTTKSVQHTDTRTDLDAIRTGLIARSGTTAANDTASPDLLPATRDALLDLIDDGRFFSVSFEKRDGTLRTMQARLGVNSHLKGGEKGYSDAAHGIVTVYSVDSGGYRSVRIDRIRALTAHGRTYVAA